MSKITEMIISAIIKKGVLYEARKIDTDIEIPAIIDNQENIIRLNLKAESMTLRIERD